MKLKLSLCLYFILIAGSLLADDNLSFVIGVDGSAGPMDLHTFMTEVIDIIALLLPIWGTILAVHYWQATSHDASETKPVSPLLDFIVWILSWVILLYNVACFSYLGYLFSKPNDPYVAGLTAVIFFLSSTLFYYLFFAFAGLSSDRPFGKYLTGTFLAIGVVLGLAGALYGKGLPFLSAMLLCAFTCWLPYKLYNMMSAKRQKKEPTTTKQVKTVTELDRGQDAANKQAMASEALKRALVASRTLKKDAGYNQVLEGFARHGNKIRNSDCLKELAQVQVLYISLYNLQEYEGGFTYSSTVLSKALMGFCLLLEETADPHLITGMMYFLEEMQYNARKISIIDDAAEDCPALSEELKNLVANLDKLNWLFATYPAEGSKYRHKVDGFVGIITKSIDIYLHAAGYGVNSNKAQELHDSTHKALADMNSVAENILNEILEQRLMKADVEMDVLRKDIRLRGLHDK